MKVEEAAPGRKTAVGEPDWLHAPEFGRRQTLLRALRRLWTLHPGPACIVETGTLREDTVRARGGDGWSTMAWGWYCLQTGGKTYTVDVSREALEVCRKVTAPYGAALEYVESDSIRFLQDWNKEERGEIHLLYLDSLDYHQRESSERHSLAEAEAALPCLAESCLVLFDDMSPARSAGEDGTPVFAGKGARAVPFLLSHGFRLESLVGGQVLLCRNSR